MPANSHYKQKLDAVLQDPVRLAILRDTELLDSPTEEAFDRLTRLASKIIGAPISLVTLVDADRQFFKSFVGLPDAVKATRETPLSYSFCQHVVASGEPLVIEDTRENPIVNDNLSIKEFGTLGYLGMPLQTSEGVNLGSFCVIDIKPHPWTEQEIEIIRDLSQTVIREIEARLANKKMEERQRKLSRVTQYCTATISELVQLAQKEPQHEEILEVARKAKRELIKEGFWNL